MVAYTPALAAHLCARVRRGSRCARSALTPTCPPAATSRYGDTDIRPSPCASSAPASSAVSAVAAGRPATTRLAPSACSNGSWPAKPLQNICREPGLPDISTVYYWRRLHPEFARALAIARRMQRELIVEEGWEIAEAATRETARAVARRLKHLRWRVAMLYPTKYDSDADLVIPDPEPLRLRRDRSSPPAQRRGRG
ncbi:hypothetical protein LRS04_08680 [Phenylobacterium sp. J367]|nr:hypothetical protein [Phenylobacterium sp. J367]MCR5878415.1 hypothetical protein [Phenylobacterium sp. J367]